MKLTVKISESIVAEVEGATHKELFKQIATLQEVFGNNQCPVNQSTDLRYVVRVVEDNEYYELRDQKDGNILSFGQHKKGGSLFPKRKDDEGKWIGNNGWHKYTGPKKD